MRTMPVLFQLELNIWLTAQCFQSVLLVQVLVFNLKDSSASGISPAGVLVLSWLWGIDQVSVSSGQKARCPFVAGGEVSCQLSCLVAPRCPGCRHGMKQACHRPHAWDRGCVLLLCCAKRPETGEQASLPQAQSVVAECRGSALRFRPLVSHCKGCSARALAKVSGWLCARAEYPVDMC